uniref:Ig-like domain-containing protein n=1 Tax=Sinocyclocheilus anshuiensis TaxID=1608454 RepID=A0A671K208_9TELE
PREIDNCFIVISLLFKRKPISNSAPAVGIVAQTTVIRCFFKNIKDIHILGVYLTKAEQKRSGDPRFSLENLAVGPSLQISDTMFSDEGKYLYLVVTDSGVEEIQLSISVTAKCKDPITSTWPEYVTDGGPVSLYCNADGYPAGFIHWFDHLDASSLILLSGLSVPFRCSVLNIKYVKDKESTLNDFSGSNKVSIAAGGMVIGSLIVGLLSALLFFRKIIYLREYTFKICYELGRVAEDDLETDDIQ